MAKSTTTLNQNEFLANLVNLLLVTRVNRTVPGRRINDLIDACLSDTIEYGDSEALISVDTLEVKDYSKNSSLLTSVEPKLDEQVLETTDMKFIQVTLNRYLMKGAFANEYSLSEAFNAIEEMLLKTKDIYTYKKIVSAYQDWEPALETQKVEVELIPVTTDEGATADLKGEELTKAQKANALAIYNALRKLAIDMQAPSRDFNDIAYEEMYNAEDLDFIVNSNFESIVNTYAYASLLNSSKLDNVPLYDKSIIIPQGQLEDDNKTKLIGWLVSKKKYRISPRFTISTDFFDGSNLNLQKFVHFWLISGMARGLAGIRLTAKYITE